MILSRPGRSGGDEPGFEAIGGWLQEWRALNTRVSCQENTFFDKHPRILLAVRICSAQLCYFLHPTSSPLDHDGYFVINSLS